MASNLLSLIFVLGSLVLAVGTMINRLSKEIESRLFKGDDESKTS